HLGRLLLAFNFPSEWSKIQKITKGEMSAENDAALEVIGVSIDEIAQVIAKEWHLPKKITNSMKSKVSSEKTAVLGSADWLIDLAYFSGEAAAKIVAKNSKDDLEELISGYDTKLKVSSKDIANSLDLAVKVVEEEINQPVTEQSEGKPFDSQEKLVLGINEVGEMLTQGMDYDSATRVVLETMYASMGFNRVVAFDLNSGEFKATVGFGSMMPELLPQLVFQEEYQADVFHLSLANKADVFIHEIATLKDASSIPTWLKTSLPDVGAFILLPLVHNGRAIGLIYADWKMGVADLVKPEELASMGVLRDYLFKAL
ncbi:MAG: HDOD domain-containing protein, partial [Nitrosomonas sp.]|nr:HDOD domain-containing protein [Nitrosomonas sp.]